MTKTRVETEDAPQAIGPYSQAIKTDQLVFTAGQIPLNAQGQLIEGDIRAQTRQVLQNLAAVLKAAGSSLDHVVKTTVYLKNMEDFPAMNEVYAEFFSSNKPARSTVEVARLPKDVLIEIDAIAILPSSS